MIVQTGDSDVHQFAESQWVGFQTNTRPSPIASGTTRIAPVVTIDVPSAARGKTLAEADLRKKTGLTVLCIRREGGDAGRSVIIPQPTDRIEDDDKLVVFGETKQIDALS
jgi:Trk K+ transport system NAD-binding subunit